MTLHWHQEELPEINLSGDPSWANPFKADPSGANLYEANLTGADLTGADMAGAEAHYVSTN